MGRFVARDPRQHRGARGSDIFAKDGKTYRAPMLVLYQRRRRAPRCGGMAQSAMGPFYCPTDQKVYLDTSFFREIETRFRGCDAAEACQFAQAYVIAHEVGHHVQNLLGILPKAQQPQQAAGGKAEANRIQVRVELQADCFAGVWAKRENATESKASRLHRAGRRRGGDAHRGRDRRRHAAEAARRATWCPTASPTAPPSSASAGSRPG